jgi:hypothetical protein
MMRTLTCRRGVDLPALPDGENLVALNATVDGRLVAVSEQLGRRNRLRDSQVTVHLHDSGHGWRRVPLTGVTVTPSRVDLLAGGEFLLAQASSVPRPYEAAPDNAQVFDATGQPVRSFRLGHGIQHLAVDEPGTIWAGYFDEGIYSGDPLSAAGIVRFDEFGRRLWSYEPPAGCDHMAECYALNVGARNVWASYYTDFPLVLITDTTVRAFPPGPVRGARAVLVHGDELVFVGGYGSPFSLTECCLQDATIVARGPVVLTDPAGRPVAEFRVVSTRGSRLFVRTADQVLDADLA